MTNTEEQFDAWWAGFCHPKTQACANMQGYARLAWNECLIRLEAERIAVAREAEAKV